ncbi:MAG: hypothetical protein ACRBB6_08955 [Neptuniibacter sp.]
MGKRSGLRGLIPSRQQESLLARLIPTSATVGELIASAGVYERLMKESGMGWDRIYLNPEPVPLIVE